MTLICRPYILLYNFQADSFDRDHSVVQNLYIVFAKGSLTGKLLCQHACHLKLCNNHARHILHVTCITQFNLFWKAEFQTLKGSNIFEIIH